MYIWVLLLILLLYYIIFAEKINKYHDLQDKEGLTLIIYVYI